jgi:Domain of unknown function (DUF4838)/Glycosyl hydrolase family 67 N-terminus/F5/8 type C domain
MRTTFFLSLNFFFLFNAFASQSKGERISVVTNGKSAYHIVIPAEADSVELHAASELQSYFNQISGALLPIDREPATFAREILIGRTEQTRQILSQNTLDSLDPDGYLLRTDGDKLVICGGTRKGTLYGVYSLLEDYLGCRKYSATVTVVPSSRNIVLPQMHVLYNPFFRWREVHYLNAMDRNYSDWQKLYSLSDQQKEWGMWVHTFDKLVPAAEYFQSHPEYFSEQGGRRIPSGQLCLSNPNVLDTLVKNLRVVMAKQPTAKYWSVSQNDNFNECQCDSCKALNAKFGGSSGTMVNFVNHVAGQFPDKIISTLAYQYTRAAPTHIKPAPNVNIMLCSIECNRSRPIATDPSSASFRKDIEDWSSMTNNIIMWDYVVDFRNLLSPFPNFRVLQPNIQYFKKNGIRMIFEQGCGANVGEFGALRTYLIAKLLWNPDINVDSVMDDFLHGYYGAAGPDIRKYIDMMEDALAKSGKGLGIYSYPYDQIDSYLTPGLIKKYSRLFDEAERAVAKHPAVLERVKRARLPLEFAILDISLHDVSPELSYFNKSGKNWTVRKSMRKLLDSFVAEAEKAGIQRLEEHGTSPEEYKKSVESLLHVSVKGNLAFGKPVKVLTQYSDEYPVGGGAALTNGFHGPADYHCNWLGFQGDNCEAVVDLQSVKSVHEIKTSFLQQWYAWIWLPLDVQFSVSTDGKTFRDVGNVPDTVPDTTGGAFVKGFNAKFPMVKARYIKVTAVSRKVCPDWHIGAGGKAWLFIDEIVVK